MCEASSEPWPPCRGTAAARDDTADELRAPQAPDTYRLQSLDGVTTTLELELGTSDVPAWYRERSAGERINYGVSVGHIKVRMSVMHDSGTFMPVGEGAYRAATPVELREIAKRIEIGLSEGALCIGAGFPYTPDTRERAPRASL